MNIEIACKNCNFVQVMYLDVVQVCASYVPTMWLVERIYYIKGISRYHFVTQRLQIHVAGN